MKIRAMFAAVAAPLMVAAGLAVTSAPAEAYSCDSGKLCAWEHADFRGARAQFGGDNAHWSYFAKSTGGNWNDVASSTWNNGTSGMGVFLYEHSHYDGRAFCVPRGYRYSHLSWYSFNDIVSSNRWSWSC